MSVEDIVLGISDFLRDCDCVVSTSVNMYERVVEFGVVYKKHTLMDTYNHTFIYNRGDILRDGMAGIVIKITTKLSKLISGNKGCRSIWRD